MMRIAVCDDNTEFLNRAVDMVKKWSDLSGTPVEIYSFDNGDSLLAKNASVRMDVVFFGYYYAAANGNGRRKGAEAQRQCG